MRLSICLLTVIAVILLMLVSCQGNPALPGITGNTADLSSVRESAAVRACMGFYSMVIDKQNQSVEMIPLRSCEMHLNLTGFMNGTMGVGAAIIPGETNLASGLITLNVTVTSALAASKFTGFDVIGILITPGSLVSLGNLKFADPAKGETRLLNADGYSRWWNPAEFTQPGLFGFTQGSLSGAPQSVLTATVNPYKYFADVLTSQSGLTSVYQTPLDSPGGRGMFSAGVSNTRKYSIQFEMDPGPKVVYGYAISASWEPPTINPPVEIPDDFPIGANMEEAYNMPISPRINTLYYDTESGASGGVLRLHVNIHDWQGQLAGNIQDEIDVVRAYSPDLFSSGVDFTFLEENQYRAKYSADLTGTAVPTHAGKSLLAVRAGVTGDITFDQGFGPAPSANLSAYNVIDLDIEDPVCQGDTNNEFNEAVDIVLNEPVIDQMCAPADYRDFYKLTLPPGNLISGQVTLFCDEEPTKFGLYDESQVLIQESNASSGTAVLDLDALGILPGTYYIRVLTQTSDIAFIYMIEPAIVLTDVTPGNAVDVTPQFLFQIPDFVIVDGGYAVGSSTNGVWLYDVSDPGNMTTRSCLGRTVNVKPALDYPYLYTCRYMSPSEQYIDQIDYTDPDNPVVYEGVIEYNDSINNFIAEPGYLYVAIYDGSHVLNIYETISNVHSPTLVGTRSIPSIPWKMLLMNDSIGDKYLAVWYGGTLVEFYNVTNPASVPDPLFTEWSPSSIQLDFAAKDNYFYMIRYSQSLMIPRMTILSLNTGAVFYLTDLDLIQIFTKLYAGGNRMCMTGEHSDMDLYDISTPNSPVLSASYTIPGPYIRDFEMEGSYLYAACGQGGLFCYSILDPLNIHIESNILGVGEGNHGAIEGNNLFLLESGGLYNAIKTIDISTPESASVNGMSFMPELSSEFDIDGDRIVVTTGDLKLYAVDASDPENLSVLGSTLGVNIVNFIHIYNDAVYTGSIGNSFDVWDISSWPAISFAKNVAMADTPVAMASRGSVLFVLRDYYANMYSLADPLNPNLIDSLAFAHKPKSIVIDGNYMYIVTTNTLEIFDITTPTAPVLLSSEPDPNAPDGMYLAVENMFAILQPYQTTVPKVVRVWPPDDPFVVGDLYDSSYAIKPNQTMVNNGYYYELYSGFGVRIFDII